MMVLPNHFRSRLCLGINRTFNLTKSVMTALSLRNAATTCSARRVRRAHTMWAANMLLILISLIFSSSEVAKCFIKIGRYSIIESGYRFPSGRLMISVTRSLAGKSSREMEWNSDKKDFNYVLHS